MAWLLFIDETGHDHGTSPYEVSAGIAIEDRAVRAVIDQLHQTEARWFVSGANASPGMSA